MLKNTSYLFLILMVILFGACKKEKGRDYAQLTALEQSRTLPSIDSAKALALYNAVATERTTLLNKLEQLYPGLKAQMDYDQQIIAQEPDSANRALLIDDFKTSYYSYVKQAWDSSGLNIASITAKYAQILNDIPFTVGDFGVLITEATATAATYVSPFPDDSVTNFIGTPLTTNQTNCGGIASPIVTNNPTNSEARIYTTLAGGCYNRNVGGAKITVPAAGKYNYVHARVDIGSLSYLDCFAGSLAGGSVAGAKVIMEISKEFSLQDPTTREIASISVVAPIIWIAHDHKDMSGVATAIEIAYPARFDQNGDVRCNLVAENWVSTGGAVTATTSISQLYKNATVMRMIK